ncbi:MAG: DUF2304 domain-containing protein [Actinomycetota bacterium]|nr:DUF2304 domain-containing protein [Actinomycetota bacterium]
MATTTPRLDKSAGEDPVTPKAHVLVLAVAFTTVALILRLVRKRHLRAKYSILWLSIGVALVVFSTSPSLLDRVSVFLGISYGPTTLFLGALTLLFLVVVHFSWELSRLEERTRCLAEEVALLQLRLAEHEAAPRAGRAGVSDPDPASSHRS